ncbi:MAG TPA: histidinol dehydrogenase, partial [Firmicutes bacterium]|nr:histidinol dehydrogenase [Bacillota bacterium]
GSLLGQVIVPFKRVGIYVPGGTAAYPSTVVMTSTPANVAGVEEIVMCTPPGPGGVANPFVLVAADICKVSRIFKVGGAQAIAAMAYGTETVPAVDKIVGPGNVYVTTAKKLVYGDVGIDMLAGPSEVLVIADSTADPRFVAADLLSQAEHDALASPILITTSVWLADEVAREINALLPALPRRETAAKSLDENGAILLVDSLDEAMEIANDYAPEHLELLVKDPMALLDKVRNAGTVFLGPYSPEPVGDYIAGPNHVLPTMGSARYRGTLGTQDFFKPVNIVRMSPEAARNVAPHVIRLAQIEGLEAHANSMKIRFENGDIQQAPPRQQAGAARCIARRIRLSANESPYDLPYPIKRRVAESLMNLPFNRYPSPDAAELRHSIARVLGVREDMVVIGAGSDELIQMIIFAMRERVSKVVTLHPTFTMYRHISEVAGLPVAEIPLKKDFSLDVDALLGELQDQESLAFLCNPNNPTGTVFTGDLRYIIRNARGIVVVDEAYHEFCGDTFIDEVREPGKTGDKIIILRTLSKAFGLAGLRIGYGVMGPSLAKQVDRARLPYNCSAISILVAQEVLDHRDEVGRIVAEITAEREKVFQALISHGVEAYPSSTNFILFR